MANIFSTTAKNVGGLFGFNDPAKIGHISAGTELLKKDIQEVRDRKKKDITDLSEGGKAIMAERDASVEKQGDRSAITQAGIFNTGNQSFDVGGNERMALKAAQGADITDIENANQRLTVGADIRGADLGAQEDDRTKAFFETPGLANIPLEYDLKAQASNMNADALNELNKGSGLGRLFGTAGTVLGGAFGGGSGAALGGQLGGAVGTGVGKKV